MTNTIHAVREIVEHEDCFVEFDEHFDDLRPRLRKEIEDHIDRLCEAIVHDFSTGDLKSVEDAREKVRNKRFDYRVSEFLDEDWMDTAHVFADNKMVSDIAAHEVLEMLDGLASMIELERLEGFKIDRQRRYWLCDCDLAYTVSGRRLHQVRHSTPVDVYRYSLRRHEVYIHKFLDAELNRRT